MYGSESWAWSKNSESGNNTVEMRSLGSRNLAFRVKRGNAMDTRQTNDVLRWPIISRKVVEVLTTMRQRRRAPRATGARPERSGGRHGTIEAAKCLKHWLPTGRWCTCSSRPVRLSSSVTKVSSCHSVVAVGQNPRPAHLASPVSRCVVEETTYVCCR
ncbi:hypothetical protein EVAR_83957_1 [Eumeta japonica]|uniref:Uncharacterized protein n=1 Tax=Eumeta variegata TaxID=151549 RepID=A0A4C1VPH7_EUMVA|nr:hypothetical protein EVAR_83957_1 [Eumeta japonica]